MFINCSILFKAVWVSVQLITDGVPCRVFVWGCVYYVGLVYCFICVILVVCGCCVLGFNPFVSVRFGDGGGFRVRLSLLTVVSGSFDLVSLFVDSLFVLANSVPAFDDWIREAGVDGVVDPSSYRGVLRGFIDAFSRIISKQLTPRLREILPVDSVVSLKGPGAVLVLSLEDGSGWWESFDYTVLEHVNLELVDDDTVAVYIGGRPYGLYSLNSRESFYRSVIGVLGYLLSYMLGPFFLMKHSAILVAEPEKLSDAIRNEYWEQWETLKKILVGKLGYKAEELKDQLTVLNHIVEESASKGWRIPFLLIHPEKTPETIKILNNKYPRVFTYMIIGTTINLAIDQLRNKLIIMKSDIFLTKI